MQVIPLQRIPNQKLSVVLGGQNCVITIAQKGRYMYITLECEGRTVRQGMLCLCGIDLMQYPTPYFNGVLYFGDVKNKNGIPDFNEFGDRYILFYSED